MAPPFRRFAAACLLAFISALPAGCGSAPATLSGTVTYRDKPVPGGTVILYCKDKQIVHGLIGADGRFTITNAPRGPAVVTVLTQSRSPFGTQGDQFLPPPINGPIPPVGSRAGAGQVVTIPARYTQPEESGLSVVIELDNQTYDIHLKP